MTFGDIAQSMTDNAVYVGLFGITLDAASAVLASVGMDIAPATLRRYAAGDRDPPLTAEKRGKTWLVDPRDVIAWALRYRAAPKIGRRGGRTRNHF